jgi:hypothetical protein
MFLACLRTLDSGHISSWLTTEGYELCYFLCEWDNQAFEKSLTQRNSSHFDKNWPKVKEKAISQSLTMQQYLSCCPYKTWFPETIFNAIDWNGSVVLYLEHNFREPARPE